MRKEIVVTLQDRGNDLTFKIKEMSASQLESWMIRALLLASAAGVAVPDGANLHAAGAFLSDKGLTALGGVDFEKAKPLLDELLGCCYHVTGANSMTRLTPEVVDGIICDVSTLLKLRAEAVKLNLGFLKPDDVKLSGSPEKDNTATQ